jgi:hypothetical protein
MNSSPVATWREPLAPVSFLFRAVEQREPTKVMIECVPEHSLICGNLIKGDTKFFCLLFKENLCYCSKTWRICSSDITESRILRQNLSLCGFYQNGSHS